jgi:hypothetical protein
MNQFKEILNQNWIGTLIGILGFLVGIIGIILWYASKSRSRLAAQANSLELVGPNAAFPSDLEFLFKGHKVPNVTLSRIPIWNIGNTTVKGDQITSSDPLRIITSAGSTILEATIRAYTRQVNGFTCTSRPVSNEIACQFDYLDPGDGALIQIIHTGNDELKVVGTLRAVPKGILKVASTPKKKPQSPQTQLSPFAARLLALLLLIGGVGLMVASLTGWIVFSDDPRRAVAWFVWTPLIAGGIVFLWAGRYMPPSQLSTQITADSNKAT